MGFSRWIIAAGFLCAVTSGCAANRAYTTGADLERQGKHEEAFMRYAEAFRIEPENSEYRLRFLAARAQAAEERARNGHTALERGDYAGAYDQFQTAFGLDPSQDRYRQLAEGAARRRDARQAYLAGGEFEQANKLKEAVRDYERALELQPEQQEYLAARDRVKGLLRSKPAGRELQVRSAKPFNFTLRNARIADAFRILTQLTGINFLLDEGIKEQTISLSLEQTTFSQVLDLLAAMHKLGSTVINESTVLVYPRTPDKLKQYQELHIRTFTLNYLDAKQAVNLVRTMVPVRKIHVNEAANSLVVRDTDELLAVIEKILDANDVAAAEVLLDVEVVELTDSNTKNVGLVLSRYGVDLGVFNPAGTSLLADTLRSGSSTTAAAIDSLVQAFSAKGYGGFVTVPSATYNFSKTLAKGEVLSNPKIRVKNREKAKFTIGTRVPITTTTTSGTSGGYSVNVQYVDVGVKVQAEPLIQVGNDIELKLNLEVSTIIGKEKLGDGTTSVVTIGTRNLETVLSIRDGETSVIGGLISRSDTTSKTKIFILGDLPILGPILSGNNSDKGKTELLLAITPRLVRGVTVPPRELASFASGREETPSLGTALETLTREIAPESDSPAADPNRLPAAGTPVPVPAVPGASGDPVITPPVPSRTAAPEEAPDGDAAP